MSPTGTVPRPAPVRATAVVLAAGGSRRLGRPKQLLPYAGTTLLGASLARAAGFGLDQLLVAVGGAAADVVDQVDLAGAQVVHNPSFTTGCSSSVAVAVEAVAEGSDGILLLLGDQPEVPDVAVRALLAAVALVPGGPAAALGACRYTDGTGHPFWLGRSSFDDLRALHGDKGVWRLLDARPDAVLVDVAAPVPRDVDTEADYAALLQAAEARS